MGRGFQIAKARKRSADPMTSFFALPAELQVLALGVILLLVHIFVQSSSSTAELGTAHNLSPRGSHWGPTPWRGARRGTV